MRPWRIIGLLTLLPACVHTAPEAEPAFKGFAEIFYAEQDLLLTTPKDRRKLAAQLQKQGEQLVLVIIEPVLGIVLAKAEISRTAGVRLLYKAPQLGPQDLPMQEIGAAIQELYQAKKFGREGAFYSLRAASGAYVYSLEKIKGQPGCTYPEDIKLRFADERFFLLVKNKIYTCSLK